MFFFIILILFIVIVVIFKNRRFKLIYRNGKDIEKGLIDDIKKNKKLFFWWSLFIVYSLIGICVVIGGFFIFLYFLEFGLDKINDWFLFFVFGIVLGVFVLELVKVIVIVYKCVKKFIICLCDDFNVLIM